MPCPCCKPPMSTCGAIASLVVICGIIWGAIELVKMLWVPLLVVAVSLIGAICIAKVLDWFE